MRVINTVAVTDPFSLANFGVTTTITDRDDMEPENFHNLLMRAVIFERRTGKSGYPLLEESAWEVMMEY